jgi:aerobic carbon-monoxide dehydrogenase small subunit
VSAATSRRSPGSPVEHPSQQIQLAFTLNGRQISLQIEPQELLLDVLRESLRLTGAKRSCDVQVCGTCTVLLDSEPVSSCCMLAADVAGREVLTIEGLAKLDEFRVIEQAFVRHAALQCGFCTPGMLLTIKALLDARELRPDEDDIKHSLSGNLCRCTGYRGILEAVRELASAGSLTE